MDVDCVSYWNLWHLFLSTSLSDCHFLSIRHCHLWILPLPLTTPEPRTWYTLLSFCWQTSSPTLISSLPALVTSLLSAFPTLFTSVLLSLPYSFHFSTFFTSPRYSLHIPLYSHPSLHIPTLFTSLLSSHVYSLDIPNLFTFLLSSLLDSLHFSTLFTSRLSSTSLLSSHL